MDKQTAARIGKYQKQPEESAGLRQEREDVIYMRMAWAAVLVLFITEAAGWLFRIFI